MRFLFLPLIILTYASCAQSLFVAGPMAGHVSKQTANIWIEAAENVKDLSLTYWPSDEESNKRTMPFDGKPGKRFNTAEFHLEGLKPGTSYDYYISAATSSGAQGEKAYARFETQPDQETPRFSFLTGSCAANVLDTSIFSAMARTPADFTLWLGDNWYLPNKINRSEILWQGAHFVRSQPVMQPLLKAMAHYAIWDDHDFGPDNSHRSFALKEDSRKAFMDFWANPSYGEKNKGIYTSFSYGDVNIFMLDDRWWRSPDRQREYKNGRPNKNKEMFGGRQMEWLKKGLMESKATFNIIATGSQVLNANNRWDCFRHFPAEYFDLMDFLESNKIQGVIFITGDRHHSEIIRQPRDNQYPLYDITISPFTSRISKVSVDEAVNPQRIEGSLVEQQNYGHITISGPKGNRKLHLDILGVKGEKLAEWEVTGQELSYK